MSKVNGVDSDLASAGVDATEQQEVDKALNSEAVQQEIESLSKDGLTDEEKDQIGAMVADKASEALQAQGREGLNNEEKMAVADYCAKCLDEQAGQAVDESAAMGLHEESMAS
jgi:hypothetical protein